MASQEIPLGTQQNIDEIYKQGAPEITQDTPRPQQSKEQRVAMIKKEISDLRLLVEYDRLTVEIDELIMKQMESWVMLGKVDVKSLPPSPFRNELQIRVNEAGVLTGNVPLVNSEKQLTVPGIQGIELFIRHESALNQLAGYQQHLIDQENERKKQDEQTASGETTKSEPIGKA